MSATSSTPAPVELTFADATKHLSLPAVRRAYACDAITVGLHTLNAQEGRPYERMLRPLFTSIADDRITFCLFENKRRLAFMAYVFDENAGPAPVLREMDPKEHKLREPSELTKRLQPLFDDILAKMERQIWNRVKF